jgi:hypothetical protein
LIYYLIFLINFCSTLFFSLAPNQNFGSAIVHTICIELVGSGTVYQFQASYF